MATGDLNARLEALETKIDAHAASIMRAIMGNPETGSPGIDGRLRAVEHDVSLAKKIATISLGGAITLAWDTIKRKVGMS